MLVDDFFFFSFHFKSFPDSFALRISEISKIVTLHSFLQDWDKGDMISDMTYIALIISFAFNIFIFCYIGEILGEEVYITYIDPV